MQKQECKDTEEMKRGFLLLEVILALFILACGIIPISYSLSTCLKARAYSRNCTIATLLAQEKMSQLKEELKEKKEPLEEGDFGETYPQFRWSVQINPAEDENLTKILLTVFWNKGKVKFTTLSSNLLK